MLQVRLPGGLHVLHIVHRHDVHYDDAFLLFFSN
jgi:hypothetical protein